MGLYEGIKDVASVVQKVDNIDLYRRLIDLSAEALDLQNENRRLIEENDMLRKKENLSNRIVRHQETYITISDDKDNILYCSCCWDIGNKLVQLKKFDDDGTFICVNCNNRGDYDKELHKRVYNRYASDGIL